MREVGRLEGSGDVDAPTPVRSVGPSAPVAPDGCACITLERADRLASMWEIVLPALIGAAGSLTVWGLKALVDHRSRMLGYRRAWAGELVDGGVLRQLEWSIGDGIPNTEQLDALLELVPKVKGHTNIDSKGELSNAEFNVRRQIGALYAMHFTLRRKGLRPFTAMGAEVGDFNARIVSWARGRISAKKLYRVPAVLKDTPD